MRFRLIYKGYLPGSGRKAAHKHPIRFQIQNQVKTLWDYRPFKSQLDWKRRGEPEEAVAERFNIERLGIQWRPLINNHFKMTADLDILLLEPFVYDGTKVNRADIDNKIKTLIDGLRIPDKRVKLPPEIRQRYCEAQPFHCLLEDDSLISNFSVSTDRLLDPEAEDSTLVIINVKARSYGSSWFSLDLGTCSLP